MSAEKDSQQDPTEINLDLKSFVADMALDLKLVLGFSVLALLAIYVPYVNDTALRSVLGLAMVLFVPGYSFIAALFPARKGIDNLERLALSFGLSIAIVPLLGLALNFTPWGIRLDPIVVAMTLFTLICVLVANRRRHELPAGDRFSVDFGKTAGDLKNELLPGSANRTDRLLTVVLLLAICLSICVLAYVVVTPRQGEQFTEFYILGPGGVADNYPVRFALGEQGQVTVGIVNHEYRNVTYDLVVQLNDSVNRSRLYEEAVTVAHNQTWEKTVPLKPDLKGTKMRIEFLLYEDGNRTAPYRDLHLVVDVD